MRYFFAAIIPVCMGLLCSCATQHTIRPNIPTEALLNPKMCRGDLLLVELHLEDGEKLWFVVDTGSATTLLDKSLEPKLGNRLGTKTIRAGFYPNTQGHIYAAPPLYLGDTRLQTGDRVTTMDFTQLIYPYRRIMGVLGMDCLRHYCIQLDVTARKMRFFDPDTLNTQDLGKAFHLAYNNGIFFGSAFTRTDFFESRGATFCVDTGNGVDCLLTPKMFQLAGREQKPVVPHPKREDVLHTMVFGGETYTNLVIMENHAGWPTWNFVGIEFLAQHLVTFNFPKQTMYLKQVNIGSLTDGRLKTQTNAQNATDGRQP